MSYETGTATGPNDLLDKIRLFCIAEGWTVNRNASITGGTELCINKGDNYINMKSGENINLRVNDTATNNKYGILINGSDGYDAGDDWDRQPGYSRQSGAVSGTDQYVSIVPFVTNFGPFPAYHFYSLNSGDDIHVEIEVSTGVFLRLGFGKLDLYDATTTGNGRYFYGTCSEHKTDSLGINSWLGSDIMSKNSMEEVPFRADSFGSASGHGGSAVRCAFDAFDNWAGSGSSSVNTTELEQYCVGMQENIYLLFAGVDPLNGIGLLVPVNVGVVRGNLAIHPLGRIHGIRYMDMTNYLPGDEFTLGSDTWQVFPWYNQGGRSGNLGIAYLKEV